MDGSTATGHGRRARGAGDGRGRGDDAPRRRPRPQRPRDVPRGDRRGAHRAARARTVHYVRRGDLPAGRPPAGAHGQPHDPPARGDRRLRPAAHPRRALRSAALPGQHHGRAAGRDARAPQPAHPPDAGDRPRRLLAAHRLHGRVLGGLQLHGRPARGARAHAHRRDRPPQAGRGRPAARARPAGGRTGGHVPLGRRRRGHRRSTSRPTSAPTATTPEEFTSGRRVYAEHRRPRGHRLDQRGRQRQVAHRARELDRRSTASSTPRARRTGSATSRTRCATTTAR